MKIIGVIPARYQSSRFPGKPLALINGKPMIWWVYNRANQIKELSKIYVATDDDRIKNECEKLNINVLMTSTAHINGTERVAEISKKIKADIYITLQGDEPIFEPENIRLLIANITADDSVKCATLKTEFKNPIDIVNSTTPKVVTDLYNNILLISRSPIPYPKESLDYKYYKPTGQYAFRPEILDLYSKLELGNIEKIEGIELMRLIENGIKIKITEVKSNTIAVDTEKDLIRVIEYLNRNGDSKYV